MPISKVKILKAKESVLYLVKLFCHGLFVSREMLVSETVRRVRYISHLGFIRAQVLCVAKFCGVKPS